MIYFIYNVPQVPWEHMGKETNEENGVFFFGIPGVFSEKKGLFGIIPSTYQSCSHSAILMSCPARASRPSFFSLRNIIRSHTPRWQHCRALTDFNCSTVFLLLWSTRRCLAVPARRNTARLSPPPPGVPAPPPCFLLSENYGLIALGSCYRASWAKYEKRKTNKMQQLDVYY